MGRIAFWAVFVLVFVALGCAGDQNQEASQESSSSSEETSPEEGSSDQPSSSSSDRVSPPAPAAVVLEEEPTPIELSGNGQTATATFNLGSGLTIFRMSYQGEMNFIVNLLGEPGPQANGVLLANAIGSFEGSHAAKTTAGEHLLDVQANGPWTITIEQPRPTSAPKTGHYVYNAGKTATDFFDLGKGLKRFDMIHEGDRNFTVLLLDKNGTQVPGGLLANEIGPYEGSRAIQVPKDDIYLLQVDADGLWSVEVEGLNLGGR